MDDIKIYSNMDRELNNILDHLSKFLDVENKTYAFIKYRKKQLSNGVHMVYIENMDSNMKPSNISSYGNIDLPEIKKYSFENYIAYQDWILCEKAKYCKPIVTRLIVEAGLISYMAGKAIAFIKKLFK